jgi:hypothetical protein
MRRRQSLVKGFSSHNIVFPMPWGFGCGLADVCHIYIIGRMRLAALPGKLIRRLQPVR